MEISAQFSPTHSPLFMAMDSPVLHQFISYLAERKHEQETNPSAHLRIELTREFISRVRDSFRQNILDGERRLHVLAHMLGSILFECEFELHSNVIGVLPGTEDHPFLIRERVSRETLFSVTDIDLGKHMLDNFRYQQNGSWVPLELSANFIEYLPVHNAKTGVNRLTSRVKAEEELCNKITDEIFSLGELVSRDKHLRQYSKFIKDIFGIKIVCEDEASCLQVHQRLEQVAVAEIGTVPTYTPALPVAIAYESSRELLEFIETKDYLHCAPEQMKKTGWRAIKSVARWHGRLFEIQVQPLSNYYLELDHMSGPSHRSFKLRRDSLRAELAEHIPLYGFYRDLLKMLFMENNDSLEYEYNNASVVIT
jgi:ppGpp synthetase/RelA/SpoT-type nucleotidyltranferase